MWRARVATAADRQAAWPVFDAAATVAWIDEGRLEVRGMNLRGVTVYWRAVDRTGSDTCLDARSDGKMERCSLVLGKGLAADPSLLSLTWLPAGAERATGAIFINETGHQVPAEAFQLRVARVVMRSPLPEASSVELVDGLGRVPILHFESVAAADCGSVRCELSDGSLLVHPGTSQSSAINVRLRLAPKVFVSKGDGMEAAVTYTVPLTRCPLSFASGDPLRYADGARIVMRIGGRCGKDVSRLHWFANGDPVDIVRTEANQDDSFVVLRLGRLESERITLTAARDDPERSIAASASIGTKPAPEPLATLEITGHGAVEFIPKNREALVHITRGAGELAVLPVEGVYRVRRDSAGTHVQGEPMAGGMVSLRFAYRAGRGDAYRTVC